MKVQKNMRTRNKKLIVLATKKQGNAAIEAAMRFWSGPPSAKILCSTSATGIPQLRWESPIV